MTPTIRRTMTRSLYRDALAKAPKDAPTITISYTVVTVPAEVPVVTGWRACRPYEWFLIVYILTVLAIMGAAFTAWWN